MAAVSSLIAAVVRSCIGVINNVAHGGASQKRFSGILFQWDDVGWHGIKGRPLIMEGISRGQVVA